MVGRAEDAIHATVYATLLALLWLSVALDSRASPFLLLASAGALLLWQPLWQADAKPPVRSLLALAAAAALLVLPSHWPAVLWLGLVAGLLAGQAHACHRMRRAQAGALALVLLAAALLADGDASPPPAVVRRRVRRLLHIGRAVGARH